MGNQRSKRSSMKSGETIPSVQGAKTPWHELEKGLKAGQVWTDDRPGGSSEVVGRVSFTFFTYMPGYLCLGVLFFFVGLGLVLLFLVGLWYPDFLQITACPLHIQGNQWPTRLRAMAQKKNNLYCCLFRTDWLMCSRIWLDERPVSNFNESFPLINAWHLTPTYVKVIWPSRSSSE